MQGWTAVSYLIIIILTQTINCNNDCEVVVRMWRAMGGAMQQKEIDDCCQMEGIVCTGSTVLLIDWAVKGLTGELPREIEKLEGLIIL
jgi:hypothetical protein